MSTVGRQLSVGLLLVPCCFSSADAADPKDYGKIVGLAFEHLDCAAYGMLSANDRYGKAAQRSFFRGSALLVEWLSDVESGTATTASFDLAPKGIKLMPIPGPPIQFHLGYIWAQVERDAQKLADGGSQETLENNGPEKSGLATDGIVFGFGKREFRFRAMAERKFEESNCDALR